ncbi:MAG: AAA family ATPase [Deltaproteobacteria bacterium]|nr:AAA family ATPase [Deltaproteobacteria bacterium]
MFKRTIKDNLPKASFFLFGPRQVGKSTLLARIPSLATIDLLDPREQLAFNKSPWLLAERVDALSPRGTVIIDEVQKVPKLLDVVHALMERRKGLRFVMSGSSARKLRRGASNLLGGRAIYRTLHPLTAREMGESFKLDKVLAYGSLPGIWTRLVDGDEDTVRDLLRSYVITYLQEEVKAEAIIRNLQGFQGFLDVAAAQFASQVNLLGVSRDCQVPYATVREYYSVLEDTLMGFFLESHAGSPRKRMSQRPRFYFFDNGVTRAMLGNLRGGPSPLEEGRLFEQWFIQEVHRLNQYETKDFKLSFWRTSHGAEVDLLVESGGRIAFAIECKHKKSIGKADLTGLAAFHDTFPKVPCYLVAPLRERQKIGFVEAIPPLDMLGILDRS